MFESLRKFFADRQSTLISGLSALLIIVVGFLLFSYFSQVNKQPATRQAVVIEEATSSGLLSEATRSSIFDELSVGKKNQPSMPTPKKEEPTKVSTPTQPGTTTYTVQPGDTLSSIAQRFYGSPDLYTRITEVKENTITNPNLIHSGNVFTIPSASLALAPTTPTQVAQLPAAGIVVDTTSQVQVQSHATYTVQDGDTLWSMAEQYYGSGFAWTRILEANRDRVGFLPNSTTEQALIIPGQIVTIPTS